MSTENKQSIALGFIKVLLCAGFSIFYIFLIMILGSIILHDGKGPDDGLNMLLGGAGMLTSPIAFFASWKFYKFKAGKILVVLATVAITALLLSPFFITN